METNELPEADKKRIQDEADLRHAIHFKNLKPTWFDGAEFGYRLGLQSKEEEVTARTMELELRYAQIEHMKEQLKAKEQTISEEIKRLREALKESATRMRGVKKAPYLWHQVTDRLLTEIDSLLSQSTDKP